MDQLLPPNRRSRSPRNSSQAVSSTSSPRQHMPAVSSQSKVIVAREKIGQSDPICQKDGGRISGSTLGPNKHHHQQTYSEVSQRTPHDASASRINSNTDAVSGSHNYINSVSRHNDNSNITGKAVPKTDDELLRERAKSCKRAWNAIQGMEKSMPYTLDFYRSVWAGKEKLQFNARDPINRYATLEHILADNKMNATTTRYRQRITLLLGTHELEAAEKSLSGVERPKGVSSKTLAIRKLACCLQTDNNKIINDNKRRRHYVHVYKKIGPGALLLLGEGDDSLNL